MRPSSLKQPISSNRPWTQRRSSRHFATQTLRPPAGSPYTQAEPHGDIKNGVPSGPKFTQLVMFSIHPSNFDGSVDFQPGSCSSPVSSDHHTTRMPHPSCRRQDVPRCKNHFQAFLVSNEVKLWQFTKHLEHCNCIDSLLNSDMGMCQKNCNILQYYANMTIYIYIYIYKQSMYLYVISCCCHCNRMFGMMNTHLPALFVWKSWFWPILTSWQIQCPPDHCRPAAKNLKTPRHRLWHRGSAIWGLFRGCFHAVLEAEMSHFPDFKPSRRKPSPTDPIVWPSAPLRSGPHSIRRAAQVAPPPSQLGVWRNPSWAQLGWLGRSWPWLWWFQSDPRNCLASSPASATDPWGRAFFRTLACFLP